MPGWQGQNLLPGLIPPAMHQCLNSAVTESGAPLDGLRAGEQNQTHSPDALC